MPHVTVSMTYCYLFYHLVFYVLQPFTWIVPGYLVGGEKKKSEKARLRKGITILVGTPGRLLDHILHTKNLVLNHVNWLVIDEADRLLDMGYEKDVARYVCSTLRCYYDSYYDSYCEHNLLRGTFYFSL